MNSRSGVLLLVSLVQVACRDSGSSASAHQDAAKERVAAIRVHSDVIASPPPQVASRDDAHLSRLEDSALKGKHDPRLSHEWVKMFISSDGERASMAVVSYVDTLRVNEDRNEHRSMMELNVMIAGNELPAQFELVQMAANGELGSDGFVRGPMGRQYFVVIMPGSSGGFELVADSSGAMSFATEIAPEVFLFDGGGPVVHKSFLLGLSGAD